MEKKKDGGQKKRNIKRGRESKRLKDKALGGEKK